MAQLNNGAIQMSKAAAPTQAALRAEIVDTFTRLSPAIEVRQSYRSADMVATLERAAVETGLPKTIRVDNGPEFVGKDLDLWAFMRGVTLDFSRPGKPTDNAYIESFNGKFRAECRIPMAAAAWR